MSEPNRAAIERYYDGRVEDKLGDFTNFNPRIEAAIETLAEWAPASPRRVLEIGCGIGATAWRMARAWPRAEVIGSDISPLSIDVARTCFRLPNLSYHIGRIDEAALGGKFHLIVLMDVYEHIALRDRATLHAAIRSLLADEALMVFSVPTPLLQQTTRASRPELLQPVDEDVTMGDIIRLAADTETHILYFRHVGIWHYGDYAHFVLGRGVNLQTVALREYRPPGFAGFKHRVKRLLGRGSFLETAHDYLGTDLLRPRPRRPARRFRVSAGERRRLAAAWFAPRPA